MPAIYEDVYTWPGWGRTSICWLRLFALRDSQIVAVATDVPLNVGPSVVNDFKGLKTHLATSHPMTGFIWFTAYLSELGAEETDFRRVGEGRERGGAVARHEIEELVGERLSELPESAELEERLLAAGGEHDEPSAARFVLRRVSDLPFPHNPSRCAHHVRFEKMVAQTSASSHEELVAVGQRFIESLGPNDFETCSYHEPDWREIAEASVRIVEDLGEQPSDDELRDAIMNLELRDHDQRELLLLFVHPIVASADSFTNGQHRSCALRAVAARQVVVSEYAPDDIPRVGNSFGADDV